jgi:hypothetical protein
LGIIDSLSAGYRFLGRHIELLIIPILLDLLLWLGPQLSVAPLFVQASSLYREAIPVQGAPPELTQMTGQFADILATAGQGSNLFDALVSQSLMHVPSLLIYLGPQPGGLVYEITNPFLAAGLYLGLGIVGVLIGVIYVNLLARRLPLGSGPKMLPLGGMARMILRQWGLVLLFVLLLFVILLIGAIPTFFAAGLLSLLYLPLGSVVAVLFGGAVLIILFYLYFVTAALVLDDLALPAAAVQSFRLVRDNFWPTLGFLVLTSVIAVGFALLFRQFSSLTSWGLLPAILANAFIGTGLAMALLVFYRTRVLAATPSLSRQSVS